jgi:hypothetical protein
MGRQGGGEDSCPVAGGGAEIWLLAENGADISLVAGGGAESCWQTAALADGSRRMEVCASTWWRVPLLADGSARRWKQENGGLCEHLVAQQTAARAADSRRRRAQQTADGGARTWSSLARVSPAANSLPTERNNTVGVD